MTMTEEETKVPATLVEEIYGEELLADVADVNAELRLLTPFLRAFLGRAHGAVLACSEAEQRWEATGRKLPPVGPDETQGVLCGVQELADLAGEAGVFDCVIEGGSSNSNGVPPTRSALEDPVRLPVVLAEGLISDQDRRRNLAMARRFEELAPFITALIAEARVCFAKFEVMTHEHEGPSIAMGVSDDNPVWGVLRHLSGMGRLYDAVDACGLNEVVYDDLVVDVAQRVLADAEGQS